MPSPAPAPTARAGNACRWCCELSFCRPSACRGRAEGQRAGTAGRPGAGRAARLVPGRAGPAGRSGCATGGARGCRAWTRTASRNRGPSPWSPCRCCPCGRAAWRRAWPALGARGLAGGSPGGPWSPLRRSARDPGRRSLQFPRPYCSQRWKAIWRRFLTSWPLAPWPHYLWPRTLGLTSHSYAGRRYLVAGVATLSGREPANCGSDEFG